MITPSSIENLSNQVNIVDVISNYIDVRKSGSSYVAKCPFHDDKNPSMSISPQKGLYYCHACGASGNTIKFVSEFEGLNFVESVEKIAKNFNITLEYTTKKTKKSFILPSLASFYHSNLFKNKDALNYLLSRGVSQQSIIEFQIGFCGHSFESINFINDNNLILKEAIEYGVLIETNDKPYARFANRIIFPINNQNGNIVGFGGRIFSNSKEQAKYINSPQSHIFNKSKNLYGLNIAKMYIYKLKQIIICEGYLDVIALHQAGFKNAVATLGTAFNDGHLNLINRDEIEILMCYDGDNAGIDAALRASIFLSKNNKDGKIILLPEGSDPADMIFQNKIDELKHRIEKSENFIDFVIKNIAQKYDLTNPMKKQIAFKEINDFISTLNPIIQNDYINFASLVLDIETKFFKTKDLVFNFTQNSYLKNDAEAIMLLSMMKNPQFLKFIEFLESNFETYVDELLLIQNGDLEHDKINALKFNSDVEIIDDEETFFNQVKLFLKKRARDKLSEIPNLKIDFKEKILRIKQMQFNILKLHQGELVKI